jgi:transglutaminase-like putative cysteine protease
VNSPEKLLKPQYVGGIATLFWGIQGDLIWFAIPMAIILEARYFLNRRWALTKTDFYRVADLTGIALICTVVFLFMNRGEYHFITTLLLWLPIAFFPLVVVFGYSTTPRMDLDVLFYSLRRQREPVQQSWDMDYVFLGMCLLGAGLVKEGSYYFPVMSVIVMATLYRLRSHRFRPGIWFLSMSLVLLTATGVHYGIRSAHLDVKAKTAQWLDDWITRRIDAMKTRTALGQVGQLKLSDTIAFRIEPLSGRADFPSRLQEAVYNYPAEKNWGVYDGGFSTTVEEVDDFKWSFLDDGLPIKYPKAKMYLEFHRELSLVPVPAQLTEIADLPALEVKMNQYGTMQGVGLVPSPYYHVSYGGDTTLGGEPDSTDLVIPEEYQSLLDEIAPSKLEPEAALAFVQNYFKDFRYTLYQFSPLIGTNPLSYFLTTSQAGHCEYFASATALLLRQLGVPSRYVVGYSISEYNQDLQMYIVRKRHAHAWTIAYINGRWVVVDTTPSVWLAMEEEGSGILQPFWDLLSNNQFLLQIWWNDQKIEDYETELYVIGFILALVLIWRIATSEQVIINNETGTQQRRWAIPGAESPFFEIENQLDEMGFARQKGELMRRWLVRIGRPELLPLLSSHNRWRFDPLGISMEDREVLHTEVGIWLDENTVKPPG